MALFEIIKKTKSDDFIVWKYPKTNFNTGSQLIVDESQEALFYSTGKALDLFGSGKYTLSTNNIPLIRNLLNIGILVLMIVDFIGLKRDIYRGFAKVPAVLRWIIYTMLTVFVIVMTLNGGRHQEFIYFQF